MKCLCLVSSSAGHIDFGGGGYVKLARQLARKGCVVEWLAGSGAQAARLRSLDFTVRICPALNHLNVNRLRRDRLGADAPTDVIESTAFDLGLVRRILEFAKPDLLLVDRCLAWGEVLAESLSLPYVAIGTPGGYWKMGAPGKRPGKNESEQFEPMATGLFRKLKWLNRLPLSSWVNSPHCNLCFLGMSFYPDRDEPLGETFYIRDFKNLPERGERNGLGVSFGNTRESRPLESILKRMAESGHRTYAPGHVFVGNDGARAKRLSYLEGNPDFQLYRWVDFGSKFSGLKQLIFFGGVGTIWQCIQSALPMSICPVGADQIYNATQVERLGMGRVFAWKDESIDLPPGEATACQKQMELFRRNENYTDTLETAAQKLIGRFKKA